MKRGGEFGVCTVVGGGWVGDGLVGVGGDGWGWFVRGGGGECFAYLAS